MQPYYKVEERPDGRFAPVLRIKTVGRVDLGSFQTARLAAVAHDVARLIYIHERRPSTDLHLDQGTHHAADGYLCDDVFKSLLENGTSFDDVCSLLKSGALADQFLVARDRQTRHTSSNTSGERPAGCHASSFAPKEQLPSAQQQVKAEPPEQRAEQQPPEQHHPDQQQQQQKRPEASPKALTSPRAPLADAAAVHPPSTDPGQEALDTPSSGKKKPMRWLEWPTKGGGQFVSCLSDRALKANMTLPARMKRELFQTSEATAQVAAYDLPQDSTLRWNWEVRDYVKDERTSTYIHNLGPFFKHYNAQAGDVMVVVASAPGAVKTTIWASSSSEAQRFKASLEKQTGKSGGGNAGSKKRPADGLPPQQGPTKAARPAAAGKSGSRLDQVQVNAPPPAGALGQQQEARLAHQADSDLQRLSQQRVPTAAAAVRLQSTQRQQSGAARVRAQPTAHASRQPSPPRQPDAQARLLSGELLALPDAGIDASHPSGGDDTQQLSPYGQMAQSPYQGQPLPPLACGNVAIKQEQPSPRAVGANMQQAEHPQLPAGPADIGVLPATACMAGAGEAAGGNAGAAVAAATHSPARMSCADASQAVATEQQAVPQLQAAGAAAAAGAGAQQQGSGADTRDPLPDAMSLASDEGGVYVGMSRLLTLITATGRVPAEAVSGYRRSFGRLEPAGRRWFHYDSLKQLYDSAEWAEIHTWLQAK